MAKTVSTRILVLGTILVLFAAGCGTPKHTITVDKAVQRIDGYVQETLRSVPTSLRFGDRQVETDYDGGCVKPLTDSGFTGQINPDIVYKASVPASAEGEVRDFFAAVASHWKRRSAEVSSTRTPDGTPGLLSVHPFHNGYRLFVSYYPSRIIELGGVLDDCIWRYGAPQPTDDP
ncbi:hypothetical protein [Actinomadura opuntiae]|uniref:hypothetical protein n=1 Tax=Actinomadura sp. OS1-43 TaxID=604315 RepID=UPI00255B2807|nr:hypothetical protein [Actinomadura sp. OS1-43]MDL4820760.1 hypothetical protein [Actinomadura sp. OS1-43]